MCLDEEESPLLTGDARRVVSPAHRAALGEPRAKTQPDNPTRRQAQQRQGAAASSKAREGGHIAQHTRASERRDAREPRGAGGRRRSRAEQIASVRTLSQATTAGAARPTPAARLRLGERVVALASCSRSCAGALASRSLSSRHSTTTPRTRLGDSRPSTSLRTRMRLDTRAMDKRSER